MIKNINLPEPDCKNCETAAYGVVSAPGKVVDGKAVHVGGLPGPDQARQ